MVDGEHARLAEQVAISVAKLSLETKAASRLRAATTSIPWTPKAM